MKQVSLLVQIQQEPSLQKQGRQASPDEKSESKTQRPNFCGCWTTTNCKRSLFFFNRVEPRSTVWEELHAPSRETEQCLTVARSIAFIHRLRANAHCRGDVFLPVSEPDSPRSLLQFLVGVEHPLHVLWPPELLGNENCYIGRYVQTSLPFVFPSCLQMSFTVGTGRSVRRTTPTVVREPRASKLGPTIDVCVKLMTHIAQSTARALSTRIHRHFDRNNPFTQTRKRKNEYPSETTVCSRAPFSEWHAQQNRGHKSPLAVAIQKCSRTTMMSSMRSQPTFCHCSDFNTALEARGLILFTTSSKGSPFMR